MAEAIKTELGFDVSQALSALKSMDDQLAKLGSNMGKAATSMSSFNKNAGTTVSSMKKIASEANTAAKAMERLAKARGGAGGGTGGTGGTPSTGAPAGNTAAVQAHIAQLQRLVTISNTATTAQQRAYQSSITAAAQFAAKNKLSTAQVAGQMKNLSSSFTGSANTMADKLNRVSTVSQKALNSAGQSTRKFSVDWATMVRIVSTQVIVRALSTLRNVLKGAVSDAREFQISIAEIATIAPTDNLNEYADSVRRISDAFNVPLDTTAAAYYQTISNQIGNTTAEFDQFVEASAKFSKTAVTDIAAAVNLGSGALNAYGKSAAEAEITFAKFFVTIKQGRVVGSELAQGLGTVHPIAAKLGVSLEEVNAALATITISGVKADKAFTQMRGVFNSFLKPTKEMSAAIKELGFETGQDLLVAYDLQAALKLVIGTTDGTAESVSKLVPRIRGLGGALALADDQSEHFTKTMEEQGAAAQKLLDKGFQIIVETDAEKATKELNKLSNFMTTEFGPAILKGAASFLSFIGGTKQLQDIIAAVTPMLAPMAIGIGLITAALGAMAVRAKLASAGLTGLFGVMGALALLPVAGALGTFIGNKISDSFDAETRAFEANMDQQANLRQKKVDTELVVEKAKTEKMLQILARQFADIQKMYGPLEAEAIAQNESILSDMKSHTDSMIGEAERLASALRKAAEDSGKNILSSEGRITKLRGDLDKSLFDSKTTNLSKEQKLREFTKRAQQLSFKAAKQTAEATTEEERKGADAALSQSLAFAKKAISIADGTKNTYAQGKAQQLLRSITIQQINAEKEFQKTIAETQKTKTKQAIEAEKNVVNLKKKQESLLEAFKLTDEEGNLLKGDDRSKKLASASQELADFIKQSGEAVDASDLIGFAGLQTELGKELNDFRVKELLAEEASLNALHDQVQSKLDEAFEVNLGAQALNKAFPGEKVGTTATPRELQKRLADDTKKSREQLNAFNKVESDIADTTQRLQFNYAEATESADTHFQKVNEFLATSGASNSQKANAAYFTELKNGLDLVEGALLGNIPTMEEFNDQQNRLHETQKGVNIGERVFTANRATDLKSSLENLRKIIVLEEQKKKLQQGPENINTQEKAASELQRLQDATSGLPTNLEQAKVEVGNITTAAGDATAGISAANDPMASLASNAERGATAMTTMATQSANIRLPALDTEVAHWGKMMYRAAGGPARGTDQISAMLSKGERVTNAKSSRKFASQLTAMNAGSQPVYRQSGGTVTNIGNVSVNVSGAKAPEQSARQMMKAFKRETRRGSGRS